jgi:putative hydrolase of the HAD superfamily
MRRGALLIDLDGVIRRWPLARDESIEDDHGLPRGSLRQAAFATERLQDAITGRVSDEAWRSGVVSVLERDHAGAHARAAVAAWSAHPGEVDQSTLATLQSCAAALRLVLVTNATSRLTADLRALGLIHLFHAVVNSSEVGVAKPEARIFRLALERAGVGAEQALFVDDTQANVEAAETLGILSHRFTAQEPLRSFLLGAARTAR